MAGVSITLDDREVRDGLTELVARLGDARPALAAIGQLLVTETDLAFRGQRDPWGTAWAPLSAVTLKRRRKGPGSGPKASILRDTGRLAGSINYQADADSVAVGSDVIYAATHQFGAKQGAFGRARRGSPIPWGDIPARAFLPISESGVDLPAGVRDDILDLLARHLDR